jgi:antitoxin (DNA-binding transcriptional repressor) of toxin-antitoxin stability system
MKTAIVRRIRNALPAVLQLIRNGESVSITSGRRVVAMSSPPAVQKVIRLVRPWANLDARLAKLQRQPILPLSGADHLVQDRDRYRAVVVYADTSASCHPAFAFGRATGALH